MIKKEGKEVEVSRKGFEPVLREGINVNERRARDLDPIYFCNNLDKGIMVDPTTYWDPETLNITTADFIYLETKRSFPYGKATIRMKLPPDPAGCWWGFEPGTATTLGTALFRFKPVDDIYEIHVSSLAPFRGKALDISDFVPSDAQDTNYAYGIEVTKNASWFYIQKYLRGVILHGLNTDMGDFGPYPYWIAGSNARMSKTSPHFFEYDGHGSEVTWEIQKLNVEAGVPMYPRILKLYDFEDTSPMTDGTYDTGTSYKSHPIPIYGFDGKTILFRADTDSVTDGLRIEVLTQEGNWRLYDSVTTSANELESYIISGNFPLARIGYEPSADGASITDAEMHLQ